ncbi:hypothetical protein RRF57_001484 [Xylaria bambusicola]|uniref:Uncharacterized protein n=1 Tax=Xylaria bambusicola TaxID=326684 RepID=A0AAN7UBY7_9PEZI
MIRDPGVVCQAVKTPVPIIYTRPICPVLYAPLSALMTTFSNTMSFIRHVMCLAASLPIAFLSKSPVFKAIALLCTMTTFYSFPMTPKKAQVICTLSFVLSTMLYYINGGIPQNQEDSDIFEIDSRREHADATSERHFPSFRREESTFTIIVTGNSLTSGLKPGACFFVFLWPWIVTPSIALYQS